MPALGASVCGILNSVSKRHLVGLQFEAKRPKIVMLQPQSNSAGYNCADDMIIKNFLFHLLDAAGRNQVTTTPDHTLGASGGDGLPVSSAIPPLAAGFPCTLHPFHCRGREPQSGCALAARP